MWPMLAESISFVLRDDFMIKLMNTPNLLLLVSEVLLFQRYLLVAIHNSIRKAIFIP